MVPEPRQSRNELVSHLLPCVLPTDIVCTLHAWPPNCQSVRMR